MPLKLPIQKALYAPVQRQQILTVVRDDIPCCFVECKQCKELQQFKPKITEVAALFVADSETLTKYGQIGSALSHLQWVMLGSVLQHIEQTNRQLWRSLQDKMIYPDQVSSATFQADYDEQRAVINVANYYATHCGLQVVAVVSKRVQEEPALSENVTLIAADCFFKETSFQLLQRFIPDLDVVEFLALGEQTAARGYQFSDYLEHLKNPQDALLRKQVLKGTFKAGGRGRNGSVFSGALVVQIQGAACVNRALDGDTVCIRLLFPGLPEEGKEITKLEENMMWPLEDGACDRIDPAAEHLRGAVVAVLERTRTRFVATLKRPFNFSLGSDDALQVQQTPSAEMHSCQAYPLNYVIPELRVSSAGDLTRLTGHRLVLEVTEWPANSRSPLAQLRQDLGQVGDRDVEAEGIFLERGIRHFPLETAQFLNELPAQIVDESIGKRLDLQSIDICSVDPPGCRDVDDALHYRKLNSVAFNQAWSIWLRDNPRYGKAIVQQCEELLTSNAPLLEVGVHIADVTHYVRFDSEIDKEARRRGTSVYLADRRIDMLPKLLTEDVCSLISTGPRFCFSVLFLMDAATNVIAFRFAKTVIRNRANLTYQEAWDLIQDDTAAIREQYNALELKQALAYGLRGLFDISRVLRKRRFDSGSLVLESAEVEFKLDVNKNPTAVQAHAVIPTMSMVEEFMLIANVYAAKYTYECYAACAVLRRHPAPSEEMFEDLKAKLKHYGVEMDTSSSISIRRSMEAAPQYQKILQTLVTRCMQLAKYFSSGKLPEKEFVHYGLALPIYTHFTSPIRRYSDDLVHRLLAACINVEELPPVLQQNEEVEKICASLNQRKEEADRAGRDADKVFGVLLMLRQQLKGVKEERLYHGEVINLRNSRATLLLRDFGVEVDAPCTDVSDDRMEALAGGRTIKIFDKVPVRVVFDTEQPWAFRLAAQILAE